MKKYLLLGSLVMFFSGVVVFSYFGSVRYGEFYNYLYEEFRDDGVVGVDGEVNLVEVKTKRDNLYNEVIELYGVDYDNDSYIEKLEDIREKNVSFESEIESLSNEISSLESKKNSLNNQYSVLKKKYDNLVYSKNNSENSNNSYKIPLINQNFGYPTGCESVALTMLLRYYGVNVSVDQVISNLKKGSLPYYKDGVIYGGNPEVEFVGDPYSSYGYGVYERPIADVANIFKSGIQVRSDFAFSEVINIVSGGKPVMVWTSIGLSLPYISTSWVYEPTMETIYWKANEHAVVVIGVEGEYVVVADPIGGRIKRYSKSLFEERYNYYGRKALYYL